MDAILRRALTLDVWESRWLVPRKIDFGLIDSFSKASVN
jgi:hypothetical protein